MKKWIYLSLIILVVACKSDSSKSDFDTSDFVAHSGNNQFKLLAPKHMKKSSSLNPDASLQLENRERETYLAVIEEPKEEVERNLKLLGIYNDELSSVGNYLNIQMNGFTDGVTVVEKSDPRQLDINGMEAFQVDLLAQPKNVNSDIYYLFTFIEGEKQLYMFMQWTLGKQRSEYEDIFDAMAHSFEEIP